MKARDIELDVAHEVLRDGKVFRGMVLDHTRRVATYVARPERRVATLTRPGSAADRAPDVSAPGLATVLVRADNDMSDTALLALTREARGLVARGELPDMEATRTYYRSRPPVGPLFEVVPSREFTQPWSEREAQQARRDEEARAHRVAHDAERAAEFAAIDHVAAVLGRPEDGPLAEVIATLRDLRERNMSGGLGHGVKALCQAYAAAVDRRTPSAWEVADNTRIIDPDGWRGPVRLRDGTELPPRDWDEPITRAEWVARRNPSTVGPLDPSRPFPTSWT